MTYLGGGKGTIAKKMIKDFSFLHLSTGDVLRKHVREGTHVGKTAQSYMVKGASRCARANVLVNGRNWPFGLGGPYVPSNSIIDSMSPRTISSISIKARWCPTR